MTCRGGNWTCCSGTEAHGGRHIRRILPIWDKGLIPKAGRALRLSSHSLYLFWVFLIRFVLKPVRVDAPACVWIPHAPVPGLIPTQPSWAGYVVLSGRCFPRWCQHQDAWPVAGTPTQRSRAPALREQPSPLPFQPYLVHVLHFILWFYDFLRG